VIENETKHLEKKSTKIYSNDLRTTNNNLPSNTMWEMWLRVGLDLIHCKMTPVVQYKIEPFSLKKIKHGGKSTTSVRKKSNWQFNFQRALWLFRNRGNITVARFYYSQIGTFWNSCQNKLFLSALNPYLNYIEIRFYNIQNKFNS
jgi:hypothetical protein